MMGAFFSEHPYWLFVAVLVLGAAGAVAFAFVNYRRLGLLDGDRVREIVVGSLKLGLFVVTSILFGFIAKRLGENLALGLGVGLGTLGVLLYMARSGIRDFLGL